MSPMIIIPVLFIFLFLMSIFLILGGHTKEEEIVTTTHNFVTGEKFTSRHVGSQPVTHYYQSASAGGHFVGTSASAGTWWDDDLHVIDPYAEALAEAKAEGYEEGYKLGYQDAYEEIEDSE